MCGGAASKNASISILVTFALMLGRADMSAKQRKFGRVSFTQPRSQGPISGRPVCSLSEVIDQESTIGRVNSGRSGSAVVAASRTKALEGHARHCPLRVLEIPNSPRARVDGFVVIVDKMVKRLALGTGPSTFRWCASRYFCFLFLTLSGSFAIAALAALSGFGSASTTTTTWASPSPRRFTRPRLDHALPLDQIADHVLRIEIDAHLPRRCRKNKRGFHNCYFRSGDEAESVELSSRVLAFANTAAANEEFGAIFDVRLAGRFRQPYQSVFGLLRDLPLVAEDDNADGVLTTTRDNPCDLAIFSARKSSSWVGVSSFSLIGFKRSRLFACEPLSHDGLSKSLSVNVNGPVGPRAASG